VHQNVAAAQLDVATGFQFHPIDQMSFTHCLRGVIKAFANKSDWTRLQKRGMNQNLGWDASSATYAALYERVAK
jgi:starch synthase